MFWEKVWLGIILTGSCFSYQIKPWMDPWLEFHFEPSFMYRYYPNVEGGYNPKSYSSHDRFTQIKAYVSPLENFDAELLIEFADTRKQSLGMQSLGAQLRYQWLDCIRKDVISWITCMNLFYVSPRSLKDVSCYYHGKWNVELGQSLGKEWSFDSFLLVPYSYISVGQANFGYPWLRCLMDLYAQYKNSEVDCFLDGYFGLGHLNRVNVDNFYGWGKIRHKSIEIGVKYRYQISKIWGTVGFMYSYRFYAENYPSKASSFEISYQLPFSML